LGHALVEVFKLGPVSPFDAAALVLVVGGVYIAASWTENYGDSADKAPFHVSLVNAGNTIWQGAQACASLQSAGCCTALFSDSVQTDLTDLLLIDTDELLAVRCLALYRVSCLPVQHASLDLCTATSSSYAPVPICSSRLPWLPVMILSRVSYPQHASLVFLHCKIWQLCTHDRQHMHSLAVSHALVQDVMTIHTAGQS